MERNGLRQMRRIDIDPDVFKSLFTAVARGGQITHVAKRICPEYNFRTVQKKILKIYKNDYAEALFKRSERNRKLKAARKHIADNKYACSEKGRNKRRIRVREYRKSERYRKWEQWCCKSYRAGKLLGITGAEVRKMWLPHLLSYRWFGVDYSINEITPDELRRLEGVESRAPQHTPRLRIEERLPCDA